jgi:hypothetical protein
MRTNKPHPFNEIRIVLDSASRTLSEVAGKDVEDLMLAGPGPAHNCRSTTYKPCGAGLRPARNFLRSLTLCAASAIVPTPGDWLLKREDRERLCLNPADCGQKRLVTSAEAWRNGQVDLI